MRCPAKTEKLGCCPGFKKSHGSIQFNSTFCEQFLFWLWRKNPRGMSFLGQHFSAPKTARTYLKVGWGAWTSNARWWFCAVVGGGEGKLTGWRFGWFLVWDDVGMFPFTSCCLGWLGQLGMYWFRCIVQLGTRSHWGVGTTTPQWCGIRMISFPSNWIPNWGIQSPSLKQKVTGWRFWKLVLVISKGGVHAAYSIQACW